MEQAISILLSSDKNYTRQKYLNWAKERYNKIMPDAEVIIGVDDSNKDKFCKSRAINNAAKAASKDIFIIVDCDMFISKEQLLKGVEQLKDYALITTHNKYYRLPYNTSEKLIKNPELNLSKEDLGELEDMNKYQYVNGGIQIISSENFYKVNGYDENFLGWGGEDTAFNCAVITLCGDFLRMEGIAYHLYHERELEVINYKNRANPNSNRVLRDHYLNAMFDKNMMMELIKTDVKGYKVDFYAPEPHYLDHAIPIWNELDEKYRGEFYVGVLDNDFVAKEVNMLEYAKNKYNLLVKHVKQLSSNSRLLLVPGVGKRMQRLNRPMILIVHGAGQSYTKSDGSRWGPGGINRENIHLFLNPNDYCTNLNKSSYPNSVSKTVGCPKMDKWNKKVLLNQIKQRKQKPVIAISFHFESKVCEESRSSFEYYKCTLPMLAHKNMSKEWKVLGHGHPRMIGILEPYYKEHGIEVVKDFDEIMERADLYIMDHMSTLYEFAATNRPVVVLNAPWYRRNIEHGHRYWECADVGFNVDYPNQLEKVIHKALEDPLEQKMKRERAVAKIYPFRDGMSSKRAAEAIANFLENNYKKVDEIYNRNIELPKEDYNIQRLKWLR